MLNYGQGAAQLRILVGMIYHSDLAALGACLESTFADPSLSIHVVVFDTSPNGGARDVAARHGADWQDGSRNAGYAWALHGVVDSADWEYDIFVATNSDVVFEEGALSRLAEHAANAGGVCYGLQKASNGELMEYSVLPQLSVRSSIAQWIGLGRGAMRRRSWAVISEAAGRQGPVRIPPGLVGSGAVVVVPRKIWQLTGGMDRDYFLFEEDRSFGGVLEALQIPAFLCGDSGIVHEGGFRSRGPSVAALLEPAMSERISWRKNRTGPVPVLIWLQLTGMVLRVLSAAAFLNSEEARANLRVLGLLVRLGATKDGQLYDSDGLRRSTQQSLARRP